tara:strand:+ start:109 stop:312 length:204 start_codon:yes stop_codon:yes gene_type:complete
MYRVRSIIQCDAKARCEKNNLLRNIGDIQKNAMDINLNLLSSIYILNIFSAIIACKIKEIKTQSPKY